MNSVIGRALSGDEWDQSAVYVGADPALDKEDDEQVLNKKTVSCISRAIENSAEYNSLQLPAVKDNIRLFANNPYVLSVMELADKLERQIKLDYAYDVIKRTVQQLADTLNWYEEPQSDGRSFMEEMEAEYIKQVRQRYACMLAAPENDDNVLKLIQWCVDNDLLLQAVFRTVELLPDYLFAKGLLTVENEKIKSFCKTRNVLWQNWRIYFFKMFSPVDYYNVAVKDANKNRVMNNAQVVKMRQCAASKRVDRETQYDVVRCAEKCLTQEELHHFARKGKHMSYIICRLPGSQRELKKFLEDAKRFVMENNIHTFAGSVMALPEDSSLKTVLLHDCKDEDKLAYLQRSISMKNYVNSADSFVIDCLDKLPGITKIKLFAIPAEKKHSIVNKTKKLHKVLQEAAASVLPPSEGERSEMFRKMLLRGDLSTNMNAKDLFKLVEAYTLLLEKYRNQMAHCELREEDIDAILATLQLLVRLAGRL